MSYTHQFGKDGFFGRGDGPDYGAPRKRRKKAKPVKKTNPARDNKPAPQPGRTFA